MDLCSVTPDGVVCFFTSYSYVLVTCHAHKALGCVVLLHWVCVVTLDLPHVQLHGNGDHEMGLDGRARATAGVAHTACFQHSEPCLFRGMHLTQYDFFLVLGRALVVQRHKLIFIETKDVVETTLALNNFKQACDCGRGAVFFSVARGKVAEGIDFDRHYGRLVLLLGACSASMSTSYASKMFSHACLLPLLLPMSSQVSRSSTLSRTFCVRVWRICKSVSTSARATSSRLMQYAKPHSVWGA